MSRRPAHPEFDAIVDFFPPESLPELVYGLVKITYTIVDGRCVRAPAVPLFHDIRDATVTPRWSPGSDFWPNKRAADVAVRGSAYAPHGRSARAQLVRVHVGERCKAVHVIGDRRVIWSPGGRPRFSDPEPFSAIPMVWSNAYGGFDPRVPVPPPRTVAEHARLELDHPGVYPRNPFGRGYLVVDEPCEGVRLPNLEDPAAPLTPENLIVGDPARWYRQPLPACTEFTSALMFHRLCWLGGQAWYHPPAGARLMEVELGLLPPDFPSLAGHLVAAPDALQEAAIGLTFETLTPGAPICVEGMSPDRPDLRLRLPEPPSVAISLEGHTYKVRPQLTNVLIEPDHPSISLTYVARQHELPRVFIPGIHAGIPLSLRVDGVEIPYDCPPTLHALRQGHAGRGGAG